MHNILIINASHRKEGSTHLLKVPFVEEFEGKAVVTELHLADMQLEYFNYEDKYSDADEFGLIRHRLFETDLIILATPMYWYSMPAKLKTVFDRFHSIYTAGEIEKLYDKRLAVIYTYGANDDEGFTSVFEKTAKYLKMEFIGSFGVRSKFPLGIRDDDYREKARKFARIIHRALDTNHTVREHHQRSAADSSR